MDLFSAIVELRKIAHSIPRAEISAGKNGLDHSINASHGRVEEVSRHIPHISHGVVWVVRKLGQTKPSKTTGAHRAIEKLDFRRQHAESTVAPTAFSHESPLTLQLSHAFGVGPYW